MRGPFVLLLLLVACGEPIRKPAPKPDATERTLPVIARRRVDRVGDAFRVSMVISRAASGLTSRIEYVDVVTSVEAGRKLTVDRYFKDEAAPRTLSVKAERCDFFVFEALLPLAAGDAPEGDVPEAWRVEGVLGGLRHATALSDLSAEGGAADCRLDSVLVRAGVARAVVRVDYRAETPKGPLELSGRIEHDLKERLLVLAELDGTIAGEPVTIRATRAPTNFVPEETSSVSSGKSAAKEK